MTSAETLSTNTFALCELLSLEWHVYAHTIVEPVETSSKKKQAKKQVRTSPRSEDTALSVYYQRLQQRDVLCVLIKGQQKDISSSAEQQKEKGELWVFFVNGKQSGVTVEPPTGVCEKDSGSWVENEQSLGVEVQKQFFAALAADMEQKFAAQNEFVLQTDGFYEPNDAKFIFRCPSLTKLNHFEVYLEEAFPTPVFQLHFRLVEPSNLLTVAVDVVKKEQVATAAVELGDMRSSWERLVGLPSRNDHSMVDVWHLSDGLVPRIISETKYSDVVPWFRAEFKRRHKRRMEDDDENAANEDELAKKDENEEDADEDDDDTTQDPDVETDELLRRPLSSGSAKAKRKRDSADSAENDESFAPTSPDTHVNTPEAVGPIQEALDGRPVKTHPLLQALQDYVDEEGKIKLEESLTSSTAIG
ncbi:hypothetical protein PHYBOEH_007918 [Phytophthora boehmeriae]|uniref:Uncharacterized protein n=1 Tax=Phytophthora boehmeriae TaxID=109152 RepID=A0A8T1W4G1_9STRA|nr:hypothetical protein PHYBOEH_007918 [Phytophthora boehmeriae]